LSLKTWLTSATRYINAITASGLLRRAEQTKAFAALVIHGVESDDAAPQRSFYQTI
jgi:hypothetical protein